MSDPEASPPPPIPATILSGFLGSGKTTLLNALLHGAHGLRLAVIVNEFGAVGVDGALVDGGAQFVELDNGCLCCALNEDLTETLRALLERGGFDHVVVETTGLADPLPVAWGFTRPGLSHAFRVDAIVTVVDARALGAALAASSEARVQLTRADIVVLNKLDLVADAGAAATALLRAHCPLAPVLPARHGDVPAELVLAPGGAARPASAPTAGTGAHVGHAVSFESYAFPIAGALDEARLYDFCDALPAAVFRLKGLVRVTEPWAWTLVNVVAGRIDIRPCQPTRTVQPGLVFIGPRLDRAALAAACAELVAA